MPDPKPQSKRYTIGQLAKAARIPITTLRYYERIGLLRPAGRTRSNYRYYDGDGQLRLGFISAAQDAGFKLKDIQTLLDIQQLDSLPHPHVRDLIRKRTCDVDQRINDLQQVKATLESLLQQCRESESTGRCAVLDTFTGELTH